MREDHRECLGATFDTAADLYQRARPDYPEELYEDLVAVTGSGPGDRLLEVGCATGKATLPLAKRGFQITCLEPGANLAVAARRNSSAFDVDVIEQRFEDWAPPDDRFDLVFAATAWHWVDPEMRYPRIEFTMTEQEQRLADAEMDMMVEVGWLPHKAPIGSLFALD
jgi:SAM-dependent methyltransferase